jgi:glycosyltransferase 2 family protein
MNRSLIIIFFILIFYIGFVVFSDFNKISNNIININFKFIPIIILFVFSGFTIMGIRQCYLLNQIDVKISIKENIKLYFTGLSMILTPGGSGQLIKSFYLKKKYNYEIKKTLPLVFVERFIDLMCIITLIASSLLFVQNIEITIIVIIGIILIVAVILGIRFKKLFNIFLIILSKIPFLKKNLDEINDIHDSLIKMTTVKSFTIGFIFGIFAFCFDVIAVFFVFTAFDVQLDFLKMITAIYPSILYGALSFIPGGIGITELNVVRFLTNEGLSISLSSTIILMIRFFTLWISTVVGFVMTKIFLKNN